MHKYSKIGFKYEYQFYTSGHLQLQDTCYVHIECNY